MKFNSASNCSYPQLIERKSFELQKLKTYGHSRSLFARITSVNSLHTQPIRQQTLHNTKMLRSSDYVYRASEWNIYSADAPRLCARRQLARRTRLFTVFRVR